MKFENIKDVQELLKRVFAVLFVVFLFFYIFVPMFLKQNERLEILRNYFTIISSISTIIATGTGISLGIFYYFDRKEYEEYNKSLDKRKFYAYTIIDEFLKIDDLLEKIFFKKMQTQNELDMCRQELLKKFDNIELISEESRSILFLNDQDYQIILKVNSFFDNNNTIRDAPIEEVKETQMSIHRDTYIEAPEQPQFSLKPVSESRYFGLGNLQPQEILYKRFRQKRLAPSSSRSPSGSSPGTPA